MDSGERVSNARVICLYVGDSFWKREVIPDVVTLDIQSCLKVGILRNLPHEDEPASHQLVGRVKAYQGIDG